MKHSSYPLLAGEQVHSLQTLLENLTAGASGTAVSHRLQSTSEWQCVTHAMRETPGGRPGLMAGWWQAKWRRGQQITPACCCPATPGPGPSTKSPPGIPRPPRAAVAGCCTSPSRQLPLPGLPALLQQRLQRSPGQTRRPPQPVNQWSA